MSDLIVLLKCTNSLFTMHYIILIIMVFHSHRGWLLIPSPPFTQFYLICLYEHLIFGGILERFRGILYEGEIEISRSGIIFELMGMYSWFILGNAWLFKLLWLLGSAGASSSLTWCGSCGTRNHEPGTRNRGFYVLPIIVSFLSSHYLNLYLLKVTKIMHYSFQ